MIWLLYLGDLADKLASGTAMIGTILLMYWAAHWFVSLIEKNVQGPSKKAVVIASILLIVAILTPSQRTIWLMIGAHGIQEVAESQLSDKVQAVLIKRLDEYLAEGSE